MAKNLILAQFRWLSAFPLLIVIGALTVIALSALAGAQSTDARSREALFDFYQRLAPSESDPGEHFHLVMIDRESTEAIGPWPWPRTVLAELVEKTAEAGAKGVVLAEPVDAPDPLSPETIGEFWLSGLRDQALAEELSRLPKTDEALANAFAQTESAAAVAFNPPLDPNRANALARADLTSTAWLSVDDGAAAALALPTARYLYGVNPALTRETALAVASLAADRDGILRRAPLLWSLDSTPTPSIALQAARLASGDTDAKLTGVSKSSVAASGGRHLKELTIAGETLALAPNSAIRLSMPKNLALPTTSAAKVLRGQGSNTQLAGAVAIIGLDADLGAPVRTARGPLAPAQAHAIAATQILAGDAPARPSWSGYVEALSVMLLGAAAIMVAQRLDFWRAMGFAALAAALLIIGGFVALSVGDVLLDPLPASLALFMGALSIAGGKSIGGVLRDDNVRGSFHDTLPEQTMKALREDGATEILDGVYRPITVLSCELRIPDEELRTMENLPDEVTKILAAASLDLRQTIIDTGGAADQADGGRMFAYYNAPLKMSDHVQAGCAAALRLIESMDKINSDLDSSSHTKNLQVHLAIGVATGPCFIGPMGHGRNNRYSAAGPAVDLAAFLRRQSELYGPAMIVDETVHRETHHHFAYLELDKLKTRFASRPASLYALIGNPFIKSSKSYRALDDHHRQMLAAYRSGDMETAKEMLAKAKESPGANIALFDIYEERIQKMLDDGVPDRWDGVHDAKM
ncbi:MAG: CHASE2 domain-containing protein [Pseudomonadota bacterium]